MSYDYQKKFICPRLLDYILIVGTHHPNRNNSVAQTPELLRRYPREDHSDFPLPPDVVFFCQPEGCFSVGPKRLTLRECTCFVFTLTDKDSGKSRYGICMNFFRSFERRYERSRLDSGPYSSSRSVPSNDGNFLTKQKLLSKGASKEKSVRHVKNNTLTSFCILSHHPFFSMFRECLFMLKQIIEACSERSSCHRVGGSKNSGRDTVWGVLTGHVTDNCPNLVMHEVREVETWMFRLLSAPVPVPSKTRVEVKVLPLRLHNPLVFAMPDHTRFSLVDFPLHLPLELLGVDSCLKVITLIMLENKIILQSRDYNALSMSVMAFVSMMYPLEYMFPVIPLLPTCMSCAEQLLLVPTPFIIGVPTSFLMYKKNFQLPDDVWLVDLDSNKIVAPTHADDIPDLPEPEGSVLKNHLKQALASMSVSPQPIKDIDKLKSPLEFFSDLVDMGSSNNGFNPLIYGNDVDSVDVATRVAMVRFFNSPNILGNFAEHTRTLRLFPRPVVAFQLIGFLKSRPIKTKFTSRLAKTQAVEYFVEWALNPTNAVFLRIQTGIFDPLLIGDKSKWFSNSLQKVEFSVYDEASTLASALEQMQAKHLNDSNPTDESGSDSDGAESTSSSYSSLSDFVTDIQNSDINGDTPCTCNPSEKQVLAVDESKVFQPPSELQVPDDMNIAQNEMTTCIEESDNDDDDDNDSSDVSFSNDELNTTMQQEDLKVADEGKETKDETDQGQVKEVHRNKIPPKRPPPPNPAFLNRMSSLPPSTNQTSVKSTTKQTSLPQQKTFLQSETSIINSFTGEINNYAQTASNTITELFGDALKLKMDNIAGSIASTLVESDQSPGSSFSAKANKPFTPLGNKKALIEKSVLVKHANIHRKNKVLTKQQSVMEQKNVQHSENQQFLKDVSQAVLEGRGIGWLKMGRVKKLMEDENYRNFVVSRLNTTLEKKLSDESQHLEDVCISKQVFKGMLTMLKALISGLEVTYQNQGTGGMASAMMVLEIAHTHFWEREGSSKSDTSNQSLASSPFGSNEALSTVSDAKMENKDEPPLTTLGSPVVVNGDEFENIELPQNRGDAGKALKAKTSNVKNKSDVDNNNVEDNKGAAGIQAAIYTDKQRDSSGYASESGDMLRELVKNKELLETTKVKSLVKTSSLDSDVSDFSLNANTAKRKRSNSSFLSSKSHLSGGYRYREGRMHNLNFPQQECTRNYIFEMLVGKDRSNLWDQVQFWEDVFLDAVAQERDIVGMDQGPNEMMERYKSLNDSEKKRLECDEDHLLGCMLYNMISFMVMMSVNKNEIKRKVRRLLGKCHIGLSCSYDINQLLDQIESLVGNDIDLKPLGSRLMQKQSFTVHWGPDNTGDMLFMEVCDDCLILRSVNGAICDRWWYEKLINMTYCPKTKVFCLWRKHEGQTQLNKFYTKKCKELYNCVKSSMEKAASKNNGKIPGLELGSEFPVHDLRSGQGGLLQVCMEGIGLLFANSKLFIELCRIKKCFTVKGGIFVLEEFDPKSRKVVQRRYKSSMAAQICYAVLCIFSYVAAGMDHKAKASVQYNAVDNRPVTISIAGSKTL